MSECLNVHISHMIHLGFSSQVKAIFQDQPLPFTQHSSHLDVVYHICVSSVCTNIQNIYSEDLRIQIKYPCSNVFVHNSCANPIKLKSKENIVYFGQFYYCKKRTSFEHSKFWGLEPLSQLTKKFIFLQIMYHILYIIQLQHYRSLAALDGPGSLYQHDSACPVIAATISLIFSLHSCFVF